MRLCSVVLGFFAHLILAAEPATRPADNTVDDEIDWLLEQARPAPAPATQESGPDRPGAPVSAKAGRETRPAVLTLSNGETLRGPLATTRDKPIRVWDDKAREYRDIPFALIRTVKARIVWQRDEKEWNFKESGSDIKIYTGKTYPARELEYELTLLNGQTVCGGVVAPIYLIDNDREHLFLLNKRQKGPVGQSLEALLYVKEIEFSD